jgi:hypothetical protein
MSAFFLSLSVTGSQGEMSGDISPGEEKQVALGVLRQSFFCHICFPDSKTLGCRIFLSQIIFLKQGLP